MIQARKPISMLGLGLILALTVNLAMWIPMAKAANSMDEVKSLFDQVRTILQTSAVKSRQLDLIEQLMAKHLDYEEMAKRSLGSTWGTLDAGQQAEFVQLVSDLLKAYCAKHVDGFATTRVDYRGEICKGDSSVVHLVIIRPNDRIPMSVSVLQKPAGWMIYDLNIKGVSLVSKFRTQFSRALMVGSYQGLVARLKAHLKKVSHGCG